MRIPAETKVENIQLGSHQRCCIMMGIPTLGMVPIEFVVGFSRMQTPINGQVFQYTVKGFEVGVARNMCVEYIMKMEPKDRPRWLFFLGDDMIPPWDGFVKLFEEAEQNNWDCLTGMYYWKGEPPTPLIWRNDKIGRLLPGRDFTAGEAIHVDLTGLDFTLIRVSLLERMEPPWFKTGPSLRSHIPGDITKYTKTHESIITHTEDVWFYGKARELKAKIGVHSGVRVAHLDVKTGCIY